MKYTFIIFLFIYLFVGIGVSFAQADQYSVSRATELKMPVTYISTGNVIYDNKVWKRDLIVYFRENYNFPSYTNTGNKDIDIKKFNDAVAGWYAEYPEFEEILDLPPFFSNFQDYDLTCYIPAPKYVQGGTEEQEKVYEKRFDIWMSRHPYAPIPLGNNEESKAKHEQEKAEFYNKYYRK